jgi:hypothetical protein
MSAARMLHITQNVSNILRSSGILENRKNNCSCTGIPTADETQPSFHFSEEKLTIAKKVKSQEIQGKYETCAGILNVTT